MMSLVSQAKLLSNKFRADVRGVTAVEYGLIAAFMAGALVLAVPFLTSALNTSFTNIGTHVSTGK